MKHLKNIIFILIILLIIAFGIFSFTRQTEKNGENLLQTHSLIKVQNPLPNEKISSPYIVKGQASGLWFFEANFPVVLVDWDGKIIAEGYAETHDSWMTEDFVSFTATLEFVKPDYKDIGTLILQRANPSDLPENDDAFEVPVVFE